LQIYLLPAVALIAGFFIPISWLPAMSLWAFVLIPKWLTPDNLPVEFHPGFVLLVVWALRKALSAKIPGFAIAPPLSLRLARYFSVFTAGYAALLTLRVASPLLVNLSWQWVLTLIIGSCIPLLFDDVRAEGIRIDKSINPMILFTAILAIIESFTQANPIYDRFYADAGLAIQHWSTYRVTASFAHPLYAGTFFSVVATYTFGRWLMRRGPIWPFALAAVALVFTVSRGALLATGIGVLVCILVPLPLKQGATSRRLPSFFIALGATIALYGSGVLQDRLGTSEATSSEIARSWIAGITFSASAAQGWLGGGAGLSQQLSAPFNSLGLLIENSLYGLLISVGVIATFSYVCFFASVVTTGFRVRNIGGLAGVIAFCVAVVGYNALEALPTLQILIGGLVILCRSDLSTDHSSLPDPRGNLSKELVLR
jgi:hypothetical protein